MNQWTHSEADLERLEVYPWDQSATDEFPFLVAAVEDFDAVGPEHANRAAAEEATRWLRTDALKQQAVVTRLLTVDEHIVSFYALASAEMKIGGTQNLRDMGYLVPVGPPRDHPIGVSHIEVVARDHRAPKGSGTLAVKHATGVAAEVAQLQGNRALTLDPRDHSTQEMWQRLGFFRTSTTLGGDDLSRLYIPIFGPYYGALPRGSV